MKSGHGRLILRDGTDLRIGYCLFRSEAAHGCRGILIGNIRSLDQDIFHKPIEIGLGDGSALVAHVISHSERHVRFVTSPEQLNSWSKNRFQRRRNRPLALAT